MSSGYRCGFVPLGLGVLGLFLVGCGARDPLPPTIDPGTEPASLTIISAPGNLQVPVSVAGAGATLDTTFAASVTISGLTAGQYSVEFGAVPAWLAPVPKVRQLALAAGESDTINVAFVQERRLTTGANATDPAAHPDGVRFAFVAPTTGETGNIAVYDGDDGSVRPVTVAGGARSPCWGPGGFSILYEERGDLWETPYPELELQMIHRCCMGAKRYAAWSLVDNRIYFTCVPCLGSMSGSVLWDCDAQITCGIEAEYLNEPDVSPDGVIVAFEENFPSSGYSNVLAYDLGVHALRSITTGPHHDKSPSWSPDGELICMSSDRGTGIAKLWVVDKNGTTYTQVTFGTDPDTHPDWSADGASIVFSRKIGGVADLWLVAPSARE